MKNSNSKIQSVVFPASEKDEFWAVNRSPKQSRILLSHIIRYVSFLTFFNDKSRLYQGIDQCGDGSVITFVSVYDPVNLSDAFLAVIPEICI